MFYHLSKINLGNSTILKPKVPYSSLVSKEGNIPRVCFSPKIIYCLYSICGNKKASFNDVVMEFKDNNIVINPSVYATIQELYLPPAYGDFRYNKEHWAIKPIKVNFIGYLCIKELFNNNIKLCQEQITINFDDIRHMDLINTRLSRNIRENKK